MYISREIEPLFTFLRGANFGGSRMTMSHVSFLEAAFFIKAVASCFRNDILPGSRLLSAIFWLASSKAGDDESTPVHQKAFMHSLDVFKRVSYYYS